MTASPVELATVDDVTAGLESQGYLADEGLATAAFLALRLERPLFVEGDAGVGKTELARALAAWQGAELIRLQCYEGLDAAQALYEWDYTRQLLHLRTAEATGELGPDDTGRVEDELYDERFLVRRPLLSALEPHDVPPVLLIDEIDRADHDFEAFLLELLADFAVTIPELGRVSAEQPPVVVITSNRTRDVHDALKRRCVYHWVDHPDFDRELAIVRRRVPEASASLARQVAAATAELRRLDLFKPPGVAETIDWARALDRLGADTLEPGLARSTLGTVLKYREDLEAIDGETLDRVVGAAGR